MGLHGYLALWCGVFGALALIGYGRSMAGRTRAQRTVTAVGRIERVREPRHGSSPSDGIPVVVTFHDPDTGEEFTVTDDGEHAGRITTAWTGREIGVRYPRGRPHAYRLTTDPDGPGRGLGWPNFAVFLVYAGAVVVTAIERGWPWALFGFGGPWAVSGAYHLPGNLRRARRRIDTLESLSTAPGRVVAVLRRVSTDDDGHTSTTVVPVVSFTTREGVAVTAYCETGLPDPAGSYGRDVTIRYAPDDPAVLTLDAEAERRGWRWEMVLNVLTLVAVSATAVVGAVLV
ncbi:DUF3592 domain-containing protein [Streptomyces sp. NPDC090298]|uniref:DUF3592 domain-containing protein n=1 Tax=Streptomyces sp. NPDC090298 TaxID=3365959 RepID=UPI00381C6CCC